MYDWIIEADIYRLNKAALEAGSARERRELEVRAERKASGPRTRREGSGQDEG